MKPSVQQHHVNCRLNITDQSACSTNPMLHSQRGTMAFVPHVQVFSTGHARNIEGNIMEGNSLLNDREGEILT